jgi:hypothetical protein
MANSTSPIVPYTIDDFFQTTAMGSFERAIGRNLYGIDHSQIPSMVPYNRDIAGLTFFVRPQLNLQADNIRNSRLLYPLLTTDMTTIQAYVRCMLDPRLQYGYSTFVEKLNCPIVDPLQAFIPILTNDIVSISGGQDLVAPTFTSKEGLYQQAYSQVDGTVRNYTVYDIDATFRNTKGDPIFYLFYIWLHYASLVFEGRLVPYPDFLVENEIDYNTRIYRITLDPYRSKVRKIMVASVAFPISVPIGEFFDYNSDKPYNEQTKDITIRFKCMGYEAMDAILISEFNQTSMIFNPQLITRTNDMVKLDQASKGLFKNSGYPFINSSNYELEWWIGKDIYDKRMELLKKNNLVNPKSNRTLIATPVPLSGSPNTTSTTSIA